MNRVAFSSFAHSAHWVVMFPLLTSHVPLALSFESGLQFILSQTLPMKFTPWHQQTVECEHAKDTAKCNYWVNTSGKPFHSPVFIWAKIWNMQLHNYWRSTLVWQQLQIWSIWIHRSNYSSRTLFFLLFRADLLLHTKHWLQARHLGCSPGLWSWSLFLLVSEEACRAIKASRNGLAISFTPAVVKRMFKVRTHQAESHF